MTNASLETFSEDKYFRGRDLPCSRKHGLILARAVGLAVGDFFILENDHDPVPLGYQLKAEHPEQFSWDYLERGPSNFQVRITRVAAAPTV